MLYPLSMRVSIRLPVCLFDPLFVHLFRLLFVPPYLYSFHNNIIKFLNPKTGRSLMIFLTQKNISLAVHLSANYHSFCTAVHFWSFYERDRGIITFREEGLPVEEFYFRYFLYFKTNFSRLQCQDVINR